MISHFEDFYTHRDVEKWVPFTLTFMLRFISKKQTESCDAIRGLEKSLVLYLFGISKMLKLGMSGLIIC